MQKWINQFKFISKFFYLFNVDTRFYIQIWIYLVKTAHLILRYGLDGLQATIYRSKGQAWSIKSNSKLTTIILITPIYQSDLPLINCNRTTIANLILKLFQYTRRPMIKFISIQIDIELSN